MTAVEAIDAWHEARTEWHREHSGIGDGGARESILGTWVDLLEAKRAAKVYWFRHEGVTVQNRCWPISPARRLMSRLTDPGTISERPLSSRAGCTGRHKSLRHGCRG